MSSTEAPRRRVHPLMVRALARSIVAAAFAFIGTTCLGVSFALPAGPSALCFALAALVAFIGAFAIWAR